MFSIKITAGKKCSLWARCSPVRENCVQEPRNTRSFFLIGVSSWLFLRRMESDAGEGHNLTPTHTHSKTCTEMSMTSARQWGIWGWSDPVGCPLAFVPDLLLLAQLEAGVLSASSFLAYPKEVSPCQEQVPLCSSGATFKLQPERTLKGCLRWFQVRVSLTAF